MEGKHQCVHNKYFTVHTFLNLVGQLVFIALYNTLSPKIKIMFCIFFSFVDFTGMIFCHIREIKSFHTSRSKGP